jgi:hypothetical protein
MTEAHRMLDEFLANTEPDTIDIPYRAFENESFVDQHSLKGAIQLAVLEGKITSSILRDGGGYRLTRVKGPKAHAGLPVHGYQPQSDDKVALVNGFKQDEERLLRQLDGLEIPTDKVREHDGWPLVEMPDPRWISIARSHFEQGYMALNRSVFKPQRVKLPEDDLEYKMTAYGRRPDGSIGEMTPEEYKAATDNPPGRQTSPEVAAIAHKYLNLDPASVQDASAEMLEQFCEEVRQLAASALGQVNE